MAKRAAAKEAKAEKKKREEKEEKLEGQRARGVKHARETYVQELYEKIQANLTKNSIYDWKGLNNWSRAMILEAEKILKADGYKVEIKIDNVKMADDDPGSDIIGITITW